jgi:signal transduction histidine kinase
MPGDDLLPGDLQHRLQTIGDVLDNLSALVAAMAQRTSAPDLWLVDLAEVVEECIRVVTAAHDVEIVSELSRHAIGYVDPVLLRRAVTNVLDNACRAAGEDGRIRVSLHELSGITRVEVSDDGPGFGRVPTNTGMGMGIVDQALRSCQGRLEIISGPGPGTTVRMSIPAQRTATP